jgi:hypothetical protein
MPSSEPGVTNSSLNPGVSGPRYLAVLAKAAASLLFIVHSLDDARMLRAPSSLEKKLMRISSPDFVRIRLIGKVTMVLSCKGD